MPFVHIEQNITSHNSHTTTHNGPHLQTSEEVPPPRHSCRTSASASARPCAHSSHCDGRCAWGYSSQGEGPTQLERRLWSRLLVSLPDIRGAPMRSILIVGRSLRRMSLFAIVACKWSCLLRMMDRGRRWPLWWYTGGYRRDWPLQRGFLPHHIAKYATCYDGVLAQVAETFSPVEECDKLVRIVITIIATRGSVMPLIFQCWTKINN